MYVCYICGIEYALAQKRYCKRAWVFIMVAAWETSWTRSPDTWALPEQLGRYTVGFQQRNLPRLAGKKHLSIRRAKQATTHYKFYCSWPIYIIS